MPIFMDRHDVSELVTAENVAQLHKEDLKVQHEFNCRGLTYWFDDTKKMAFCLVDAPDAESIQKMHNHAHGEVPNQIIEVDPNLVESFLGRIHDPDNPSSNDLTSINESAQRTLMFVQFKKTSLDGVLYSQSKANMQHAISAVDDLIKQFGGRRTNHKEGYLLISFKSAHQAVLCALELENSYTDRIALLYNSKIQIKIGLASGVPVEANKTFFEDTIKLAERLCFIDKADIVISAEVQNLCAAENVNTPFDKDKMHFLPVSEQKTLNTFIDFIEKEWHNSKLKVEDFDFPLGMSRTQVYRKIMLLTGKSPNSFLKEYRLNRALEKINKNTYSISEVAFETGFNSLSYFSKCFHRRFDLLPTEYLKS